MGALIWYGSIVLIIIIIGLAIWGLVAICKKISDKKLCLIFGVLSAILCVVSVVILWIYHINIGLAGFMFIISCLMFWQYGKMKRKGVNNDKGNTK
jgi:hypothetical protein